jgi:hypothetical protein
VSRFEPAETLQRPEPGSLARGAWEAPAWAFYVAGGVVLLAALLYLYVTLYATLHAAGRAGLLRRRKPRP